MSTDSAFYSVRQVKQILGIGLAQTYAAIADGQIPAVQIGKRYRIPKQVIDRMVAGDGWQPSLLHKPRGRNGPKPYDPKEEDDIVDLARRYG